MDITIEIGDMISSLRGHGQRPRPVERPVLPIRSKHGQAIDLDRYGITTGHAAPGNPLLHHVELPPSWRALTFPITGTTQTVVVKVFYKAAFHDRRAYAHVVADTDTAP